MRSLFAGAILSAVAVASKTVMVPQFMMADSKDVQKSFNEWVLTNGIDMELNVDVTGTI